LRTGENGVGVLSRRMEKYSEVQTEIFNLVH
jgi:hypothetical protein